MAGEDTYDGRKPAFNFRGQVRGFRSRPGAPQADLTGGQYDQFKSSLTPKSNWESIFRPKFGAPATAKPTAGMGLNDAGALAGQTAPAPGMGTGFDDSMMSLDILANGGPSHTERWSQPDKKDTFGWTATPVDQQKSIASKYGASFGMGWDSAFRKTNG